MTYGVLCCYSIRYAFVAIFDLESVKNTGEGFGGRDGGAGGRASWRGVGGWRMKCEYEYIKLSEALLVLMLNIHGVLQIESFYITYTVKLCCESSSKASLKQEAPPVLLDAVISRKCPT